MPVIADSQAFGLPGETRLSEFEAKLGHPLPGDYRAFLLEHNGGTPQPAAFALGCDVSEVHLLYGLHDGPEYAQLEWALRTYAGRVPPDLLPIGSDPGGNELCVCLAGGRRGRIYFWDHESHVIA